MTRLKSSVSPGFIQAAIVLMWLFIVAFIWLLDHQQHRAARTEALESKSAEHLNLATIIAEHLNQLADRSKAVSQVFLAENIALAEPLDAPATAVAEPVCRQDDLRIAVIPKKSMEVLVEEYRPLLKHLSKGLNLPVEFVRADDFVRQEKMAPDALRVLWRSEAIHYDPFVFGPTVCAEHKAKIKRLMLEDQVPLNAFFLSQQATGLVSADHGDYAPLNTVMGGQSARQARNDSRASLQ